MTKLDDIFTEFDEEFEFSDLMRMAPHETGYVTADGVKKLAPVAEILPASAVVRPHIVAPTHNVVPTQAVAPTHNVGPTQSVASVPLFAPAPPEAVPSIASRNTSDQAIAPIFASNEVQQPVPEPEIRIVSDLSGLEVARRKAGISRKRLAELSGVSLATINKLEKGFSNPLSTTLRKLSRALNAPIDLIAP